jgi:hypothetical protein
MSSRGGTDLGDSQPQSMQHLLNDSRDLKKTRLQSTGQSMTGTQAAAQTETQ